MSQKHETIAQRRKRRREYYQDNRDRILETSRKRRVAVRQELAEAERAALKRGDKSEYCEADGEKLPRNHKCLSRKEMERILRYSNKSTPLKMRNTIMVHLLAGCGLKSYEVSELRTGDINTATGYITTGRANNRRDLPMVPRTIPLMVEYLSEYRRRLLPDPQCDTLLPSQFNRPLSRDSVHHGTRAVGKELGIKLNPEMIRKAFTSHYNGSLALFLNRAGITTLPPALKSKNNQ